MNAITTNFITIFNLMRAVLICSLLLLICPIVRAESFLGLEPLEPLSSVKQRFSAGALTVEPAAWLKPNQHFAKMPHPDGGGTVYLLFEHDDEQRKKKLADLQAKIRKSNVKIGELEKVIANLNNQLAERDSSINTLNEKVLTLNGTITTMQSTIDTIREESNQKSREITDKVTKLNTAFYTIGTYKELRDKKVLSKQGGFLGLGKQKSMLPDFNQEAFTQIDVTSTKLIEVNKKDAKLISTHPNGTYKVQRTNDKVTSIEITDPDKFWKASKYLVVVTE
jgi:uncharacterized coiled-coil protein SlyX